MSKAGLSWGEVPDLIPSQFDSIFHFSPSPTRDLGGYRARGVSTLFALNGSEAEFIMYTYVYLQVSTLERV